MCIYISNIKCDVLYHLTKFEIETQHICGETKKTNLVKVLARTTKIVRVSKLVAYGVSGHIRNLRRVFFFTLKKNRTIYSNTCGLKGIEVANYFHSSQIHMNPMGPSLCKQTPNYT